MRLQVRIRWKIALLLLVVILSDSGAIKRCSYGLEYGEDCAFVPAPPGRTPHCAAPGYTYCEQPDYYPRDLIRHLVERGEYDISTLLSDETKDEFGANSGPYGYGPHSIPGGVGGISLVTERPSYNNQRPRYPNNYDGYNRNNYNYNNQPSYNKPYHGPKEDPLPPPPGYVGYYQPSYEQRAPPYLPPALPPPPPPHRPLNQSSGYRGGFDDWSNGDFFPSIDFSSSSNGPSSYFSSSSAKAGQHHGGQANAWAASGTKHHREYAYRASLRQTLTPFNPEDWWQRYSYDNRRTELSELPFKTIDSNELKPRHLSKRDLRNRRKILRQQFQNQNNSPNPAVELGDTFFGRQKRQAGSGGEQLCPTRSQYIMPRAALNKEGNWMYVVNMENDSTYSQLVKSEVCVSNQCSGLCSLPVGYSSKCEQKYVQKRLVALDQGGQRLYTDIFWFPSCCLCTINNNQT